MNYLIKSLTNIFLFDFCVGVRKLIVIWNTNGLNIIYMVQ